MNKIIKIIAISVIVVLMACYTAFLFVLPNAINLNGYKDLLQSAVKEQSKLSIDFSNAEIITTPLLGVGVKVDDLSVKLPDDSLLFSADSIKTRIALPSLLLLTVKVSCLEAENPFVNLEIENDKNFKIMTLVQDIINEAKHEQMGKVKPQAEAPVFNPEIIRIKVPDVKFKNYKLLVNDLKSKHYLTLCGNELSLGYFNGKRATIKGDAELLSDENKNIFAKFDINTFLPKVEQSLDEEDDEAERIEFPFVNPVTMFRRYDLKTNIDTQLLINSRKNDITSYGHLNIDGLTLKVSDINVPESYLHVKTFGKNVNLDTDINITEKTKLNLLGKLNYGKHPKMDISIKTGKIYFNDLLLFAKALLNSLDIKNELNTIGVNGYIEADTCIKTNFKKLKSDGFVRIKDGVLNIKNLGKVISDANINILLNNDILDVKNSSLYLAGSKISVNGRIDDKSVANVKIKMNNLSLPVVFKAFTPNEIKNTYSVNSGRLDLNVLISGKLKEAVADISFALKDLNFEDKHKTFSISDDILEAKLQANAKTLTAGVENNNFSVNLNQTKSKILIPKVNVKIANGNIEIDENKIFLNDKSYLSFMGNITNYHKLQKIRLDLNGQIDSDDLIKFIGTENRKFINSSGVIPLNLSLKGNSKKQTMSFEIQSDDRNYFTPADIERLSGKNTLIKSVIDFKPNRIKIKDTGLYTRRITVDEKGNERVHLNEIIGVDGTIAQDTVNLIKITVHHPLSGKIYMFPKSTFKIDRSRAFIYGKTNNPRIRGRFKVDNILIPELLFGLKEADIKLNGTKAELTLDKLSLNGSEIDIKTLFKIIQNGTFNLENLTVNSKLIDVDKVMKVAEAAEKHFPSNGSSAQTSSASDIPIKISDGKIDIAHLKTGNIQVFNTKSDMLLENNILFLNNLTADVFDGSVSGDISTDLITSLLNIKMKGNNINVDKAMVDAAGMKDTLSGRTSFDVNLSLKGATYEEQMKTMKGIVNFHAKYGQYGPFGKIENLIIAENIRESEVFKTALGGIIKRLSTIDTTHYNDLSGTITFKNGICTIEEITSAGEVLMLHIFGDFDLLQNTVDMKIRAKMNSILSQMLGPIAAVNPIQLVNSAAGTNIVTAKAFSLFCETLTEEEINTIPSFPNKYLDATANSNRFQLVARGDVSKPLTLIKSFKWIATKVDFDKAANLIASLPEQQEGSTAQTIEELLQENAELEQEKKTLKYKITHIFSKKDKKKKNKVNKESENIQVSDMEKAQESDNTSDVKAEKE